MDTYYVEEQLSALLVQAHRIVVESERLIRQMEELQRKVRAYPGEDGPPLQTDA